MVATVINNGADNKEEEMEEITLVSMTTTVPVEMQEVIKEIAESRDVSLSEIVRILLADAIKFDLSPFFEQRERERAAREAKKAEKEAIKKQEAESKKAVQSAIMKLLEEGLSFEDIAKRLNVSVVK